MAVPDFAFGAMENLGCVTFREILLLVDPTTTTQAELLNVTDVINHELAHMWFGDLVTMKWWNGIWLNEAFATFMEMHATDAFRPEWERWVTFGLSRTAAFDIDALSSTRPIEYPVVSPADAEGMFDILTYEKGAAVVRMLEQYLGEDEFRDGIRAYLAANAYGNTETTDLWDAIEEATGEPVRRIMDSWIFQGGFPIIDVDLVNDGRTLRLTQERFAYAGDLGEGDPVDDDADAPDTPRWAVPLIFSQRSTVGDLVTFEKVLLDRPTLDLDLVEPVEWLLVNTEGTGFYRVRYAPGLLAALVAHAQSDLSPIERYGLVDDVWAGVLAGDKSAHDFLVLAEAFGAETDLSVWQRIIGGLERPRPHRRRRRPRGAARPGPRPAPPRPRPPRRRRPAPTTPTASGRCAACCSRPSARSATTPTCTPGPGCCSTPAPLDPDPALVAASVNVVAAMGHRGRLRRLPRPHEGRHDPAGGAALPRRAGRLPRPRARAPAAGHEHHRRGAHPERAATCCAGRSPTATTAGWPGSS